MPARVRRGPRAGRPGVGGAARRPRPGAGRASSTSSTTTSTGCRSCFARPVRAPLVTTIHGFSGAGILPGLPAGARRPTSRSPTPTARRTWTTLATVHHGVDLAALPFRPPAARSWSPRAGSTPTRAPREAIEIARRAGRPSGALRDRAGPAVLRRAGRPAHRRRPGGLPRLGRSPGARSGARAAAALLHPIAFDEPFGLSVVESMVCGTPVVAYRAGVDARGRRRGGHRVPRVAMPTRPSPPWTRAAALDRPRLPRARRGPLQRGPDGQRLP